MYEKIKSIFAKKLRHTRLVIGVTLIFAVLVHYSYSIENSTLRLYYGEALNTKAILEGGILKKYYYLTEKNDFSEHKVFDYINQLVTFRAELLQFTGPVKTLNLIIYDRNGRLIFSSMYNQQTKDSEHLLTDDEMYHLLNNQEVMYNKNNAVVSISSIFYNNNIKPSFFLKIIKAYDKSYISALQFIFISLSLLLMVSILAIYYLNITNREVLSHQHRINAELKQVKDILEQESASKLKFLASVTHELRTPLNAIIGFAELMKSKNCSTDNNINKEYVNEIHSAGMHLLSLINDVLDFSRAESNNLTIEKTKFNLNKIIDSCINMLSCKLAEAETNLVKEIPNKQLIITADPKRMKQVILNLISNAIKFTNKKGTIKIVVKENTEKNLLSIEFHDNGIGIMQQDIYRVMSVFGQVESEYRNEGTGLGLPLSKKIVELMGGTFSIESQPCVGTVITLNFSCEEQACRNFLDF